MARYRAEQSEALETKPVGRLLLEFAAPGIIAMSASSIYNICDSIFIGHHSGSLAIAGMAVTFPLMNILSAFACIASVGGSAQASIHMGMQMRRAAHSILGNVLLLNVLFSTVLCAIGLTFLDPILSAFGASEATMPYARSYMRVILMGVLVSHVFQSLCGQLRSTGYPRAAMRAQLLAVGLNILFDLIFIFGFDWGIKGAALATVCGQVCALASVLPRFFDHRNYLFFSRSIFRISWTFIREIISIGISPFLANVSGCLIVTVVNLTLVRYGGDMYIGAYGITNRITQLLIMMVAGFSQGMQPVVGYNLGAGRYDRVRKALSYAVLIATLITSIGYALIATFPAQLASLFTTDQQMIDVCIPALRIALFTFPVVGSQMIAVAFFQSVRRAKISITITLTRQLCFLLPFLFILPSFIGVNGVWWSMSLADIYSVLLSWFMLWRILRNIESIRINKK